MRKKNLYFYVIICCILTGLSCVYNPEDQNREKKNPITAFSNKGVDTAIVISKLVDYYNYKISAYALKNEPASLEHFESLVKKSDKSFNSLLGSIPEGKDKNKALCNEIDSQKQFLSSQRDTSKVLIFLSKGAFLDSPRRPCLFRFYKNRINEKNSQEFQIFLDTIKKNIGDSMHELYKKSLDTSLLNKTSEESTLTIPTTPSSVEQNNSISYIISFVVITLFLIGLYLYKRKIKKRKAISEKKNEISIEWNKTVTSPDVNNDVSKSEMDSLQAKLKDSEEKNQELRSTIENLQQKIYHLENSEQEQKPEQATSKQEILSQKSDEFYFPASNNDSFQISLGSNSKRAYDVYLLKINGNKARFSLLVSDAGLVKRVLESPNSYILSLCEFAPGSIDINKASNIVVKEEGILQKEGDQWKLKTKSIIKLS